MALYWKANGFALGTESNMYPMICAVVITDDNNEFIGGMKFYGDAYTVQTKVGVSPNGIIYFKEALSGEVNIHIENSYGVKYVISTEDIIHNIFQPNWIELQEET